MAHFLCQLDWVTGYPVTWLAIILGVSIRVFLGEINIWISRERKAGGTPKCEYHLIHWGIDERQRREENLSSLSDWWSWNPDLFLPLTMIYTTSSPRSPACRWQTVGLLSLHNQVNQFLTINLYWFCFSGEPCLILYVIWDRGSAANNRKHHSHLSI